MRVSKIAAGMSAPPSGVTDMKSTLPNLAAIIAEQADLAQVLAKDTGRPAVQR